ncbi:MAG: hypothetical protein KC656_19755, partial [Myxococcales bacterium]|nr:hypothetical protein [Myxococcales bacterium]
MGHPDLKRIGEQADLDAAAAALGICRLFPSFGAPGWPPDRPIEERCVSRQPFRLEEDTGGVTLHPNATTSLFGDHLDASVHLEEGVLERGVLVALGRWVLLHVRRLPPGPASSEAPLLGISREMIQIQATLRSLTRTDGPVLLLGSTDREAAVDVLCSLCGHDDPVDVTLAGIASAPALREELFGTEARPGLIQRSGPGVLWIRDIGQATPEMLPVLQQALDGRAHPVGEVTRDVSTRIVAAATTLEEVPEALRDRFHDVVTLPDVLPVEDVAWHLGRTLTQRLGEVGREELVHRNPGWAEASALLEVFTGPWRGDSRNVANLARRRAASISTGRSAARSWFPGSTNRRPGASVSAMKKLPPA